jgi:Rrf2 family protein
MLYLAKQGEGKFVLSKKIAAEQDVPPKFLPQILVELSRAGLVYTVRGAQGGVRLSRPASKINVREILEAVEGPLFLSRCLSQEDECQRKSTCPIRPVWTRTQEEILNLWEKTSLEELARPDPSRKV